MIWFVPLLQGEAQALRSMSPYLLLLCSGELITLLKRAEARGDIHGIQVCRGAPSLSHLLFSDEFLLFFRANLSEVDHIKHIL